MSGKHWNIPDLIDLEFFLDQDEGDDLDELAARDRKLFVALAAEAGENNLSPASLLRGWLNGRKKKFTRNEDNALPGQIWQELFSIFFWSCLVGGLVSGGLLAFTFLSYSGTRPVNVAAYFTIFVVLEVVLFVLLIGLSLSRHLLGRGLEGSFFCRQMRRLFYAILDKFRGKFVKRAVAGKSWPATIAGIRQLQQRYGSIFIRPFFLLVQVFGVWFNAGVLAATLLKVTGSDLAFSWQSTLQISSETVSALVRWISLPWAWLGLAHCCPTPNQVEGSRLILKDGIYHLATPDLVSWWPFLCLSVLFYGLLPRLVLLFAGYIRQYRALAGLNFNHGRYRQLLHRMQTPTLSSKAREEKPDKQPGEEKKRGDSADRQPAKSDLAKTTAPVLALVPDELYGEKLRQELADLIRERLAYQVAEILPVWTLERSEEEELALIAETMTTAGSEDIVLLQEAWQPPIQEHLVFLGRLRRIIGKKPILIIALTGRSTQGKMLAPVEQPDLRIWRQKISTLADPGLQLVELIK